MTAPAPTANLEQSPVSDTDGAEFNIGLDEPLPGFANQQANVAATSPAVDPAAAQGNSMSLTNVAIGIAVVAFIGILVLLLLRRRRSSQRHREPEPTRSRVSPGDADLRRLVGDMKQELNTLQSRYVSLERKVDQLAARAPLPVAEEPKAPPPPPPAPSDDPGRLVKLYGELLSSGIRSRERFDAFFRSLEAPHVFVAGPDGASLHIDDDAEPLVVGGLMGDKYLLFPAFDFVSNFATLYNTERAMPPELRLTFDFTVDETRTLLLHQPAVLSRDGGRYKVVEKGKLSGLTS